MQPNLGIAFLMAHPLYYYYYYYFIHHNQSLSLKADIPMWPVKITNNVTMGHLKMTHFFGLKYNSTVFTVFWLLKYSGNFPILFLMLYQFI